MPKERVELSWDCSHRLLRPARMPIPPLRPVYVQLLSRWTSPGFALQSPTRDKYRKDGPNPAKPTLQFNRRGAKSDRPSLRSNTFVFERHLVLRDKIFLENELKQFFKAPKVYRQRNSVSMIS